MRPQQSCTAFLDLINPEDDLLSEASRNQPLGNAGYYHPTTTQVSLARPSTPPPTQLRSVLLQPQYSVRQRCPRPRMLRVDCAQTPLPRSPAGPSGTCCMPNPVAALIFGSRCIQGIFYASAATSLFRRRSTSSNILQSGIVGADASTEL